MESSDGDLLAVVAAGGEPARAAWSALVGRHTPKLYAVARSFAVDPATAEDLVQTAWLRLLERVDRIRDPDAVGCWLAMVVRNEARNRITRRREIPTELSAESFHPADDTGVDSRLLRDERAGAIRYAFAHLGEECRQLLRLLVADPPLSYDEIAAAVGRPRGALGPTRRRCLDRLRALLPGGFEK